MFEEKDLKQFSEKGISAEQAKQQIENFKKGFPFVRLINPAVIDDGIMKTDWNELQQLVDFYDASSSQKEVLKFVPASGAATRMFKDLFGWKGKLDAGISADDLMKNDKQAKSFFDQLQSFAFWDSLKVVMEENGRDASQAYKDKDLNTLLDYLLNDKGLGYASLPKGLLKFHRYDGFTRTSMEEHLVEGIQYGKCKGDKVNLHFTVSPEHRGRFINHLGDVLEKYEEEHGVDIQVDFSAQKPSTDTMAVDLNNDPFRESDGSVLFRPGGHGALIQNLNDLDTDILFVKNIDNVVPDRLKDETVLYKKAIGGLMVRLQEKIFEALHSLENNTMTDDEYKELKKFASDQLFIHPDQLPEKHRENKNLLFDLLNRPIRVCGMVENVGEPGGGPFWVEDTKTGSRSLQIVESSQVDHDDPEQERIFQQSTHFNPVDLVCGIKNYKGEKFDLTHYVDRQTGFISYKSKDGKDLKAQELPGLWNGAMAHWITVFVEVPLITFNPVKTILDLLRNEHK
ncbi:MAG: DUF4301 family protein [Bacteroidales bacterium]